MKMKSALVFCVFFVAALALARPGDEHYTDKYDNIDMNEILNNEKIFENYYKCIMDEGTCTPEGKELKAHLAESINNDCAKCTEKQKKGTDLVLRHLINKTPDKWAALKAKYDPENKYAGQFEKDLQE